MKRETGYFILIFLSLFMIVCLVWTTRDLNASRDEVKNLSNQIIELNNRNHNDSILISEYQEGLNRFTNLDPLGADRFRGIIERINTKP